MLLSGIGGYLVSKRRGNKISAVAVAEAAQGGGGLTTNRRPWSRATPRIEPAAAPPESPRRVHDAESPRAPPIRQGRLPPLNRGPPRRAAPDDGFGSPNRGPPRRAAPDDGFGYPNRGPPSRAAPDDGFRGPRRAAPDDGFRGPRRAAPGDF